MSSKALNKTPKVLKALTKKTEHLREHLGVPASSRALFPPSRALFVQSCPCPRLGTTEGTTARIVKTANASALCHHDERHIIGLALRLDRSYRSTVAANSATGFGDPSNLAQQRPIRQQALFLCLPYRVMAAVRGRPSGLPGSKFPVRQPAYSCHPKSFGDDPWQLQHKLGALPMTTLIPPKIRAIAHRRMALSALRANSSLSVRLKRYNHHIAQARALEAQGGAA